MIGKESTNRGDLLEELRKNIRTPEEIQTLAKMTGMSEAKVETVIKSDSLASISDIMFMHQAYKELVLRNSMVIVMKDYFKFHPTEMFDLAREANLTPQQVEHIINNHLDVRLSDVTNVYNAFRGMQEIKEMDGAPRFRGK